MISVICFSIEVVVFRDEDARRFRRRVESPQLPEKGQSICIDSLGPLDVLAVFWDLENGKMFPTVVVECEVESDEQIGEYAKALMEAGFTDAK
jgi:hypothetical protein